MTMSENLEFPNFFGTVKDLAQARYYQAERDKIKGVGINPADVSATMQGDRDALGRVAAANPDMATRLTMALSHMDARQAATAKSHFELAGRLSAGVLAAPPADRPAMYADALAQARSLGIDTSRFPQGYGPATEAWLKHNAQMLGTASQIFKRINAPAAGAGGGGGGWTNPGAPVRTSDAAPPGGPMVADSGGGMPAPSVAGMPQPAPAMAPPAQAPTAVAGAGPMPMAVPPAAPRIAPASGAPVQMAGVQPPQAPQVVSPDQQYAQGADGDFVPPDRVVGGGGRFVGLPDGAEVKVDAHNKALDLGGKAWVRLPGQNGKPGTLGVWDPNVRKMYAAQDLGDRVVLLDLETGQKIDTLTKGAPPRQIPTITEGPPSQGAIPELDAVRGLQVPQGWRVALYDGQLHVKDGAVEIIGPNKERSMIPLPQRAEPRDTSKAIPPAVLHGIDVNLTSLRKIDKVMSELEKNPDSVGGPGSVIAANIPGAGGLQNRMDKGGVELRALIADIGSLKIHDRSGAAVTASEEPRLRPFIPSISDDPATVRKKLGNFKAEYMAVLRDQQAYYAPDNGFKSYKGLDDYLSGGGAPAPAAAAPAGGPSAAPKPADKPTLIYDPKSGGFK